MAQYDAATERTELQMTTSSRGRGFLAVLGSKTGLSASLSEVIAAVTISVAVLGLAGFGVGAAMSFSRESDAKSAITSIRSAEIANEAKTGRYASLSDLASSAKGGLDELPSDTKVFVNDGGTDFCVAVKAESVQGTQFLAGQWIEPGEVVTPFNQAGLKGCHTLPGVFMDQHTTKRTAFLPVPVGSTRSCLRFNVRPGRDVVNWYIGAGYYDAAKQPVPNTASPNSAGGYYSANGAMRSVDTDGYCFGVGPEVKFIQWNFNSSSAANYGPGALNTVGSLYRDVVVLFH